MYLSHALFPDFCLSYCGQVPTMLLLFPKVFKLSAQTFAGTVIGNITNSHILPRTYTNCPFFIIMTQAWSVPTAVVQYQSLCNPLRTVADLRHAVN